MFQQHDLPGGGHTSFVSLDRVFCYAMNARWEYGDGVRLVRNVKNDGTYPEWWARRWCGAAALAMWSISAPFAGSGDLFGAFFWKTYCGCREEELIDINDPWTPSRFGEFATKSVRAAADPWAAKR